MLFATLAAVLPFADVAIGRAVLQAKCKEQCAVVTKRSIAAVDGFFYAYGASTDAPNYYRYRYVEGNRYPYDPGVPVDRVTATADGKNLIEKRVPPKAIYELVEEYRQDSLYFFSNRTFVRVIATKEELSSFVWLSFRGGWAERTIMMFSGAGPSSVASCGDSSANYKKTLEALHSSLLPATAP